MDILTVIATKVKDFYGHNMVAADFVYEPIFPCVTSILFTFGNALVFHLNTVVETAVGTVFLILLGHHYLTNLNSFFPGKRTKILFALLIGFVVFGLHKWEASLTSFFSFAVFFDLCICFFNYFFIVKYIDDDRYVSKKWHIPFLAFTYLLVIFEEPSYFYGYLFSITVLLVLVRRIPFMKLNIQRWKRVFILNVFMLIFTIALTTILSKTLLSGQGSDLSLAKFFGVCLEKPLWMIKFYLIANTGPFFGELHTHIDLRALGGLFILLSYAAAIWYVIKKRVKILLVPVAMIFYNLVSYGFVTMGRYTFDRLQYGASSRYTAFNMAGVLGLTTILFFVLWQEKNKIYRTSAGLAMAAILVGYLRVYKKQIDISPYRTEAFLEMRKSLLTRTNLQGLQNTPEWTLAAIDVMQKYNLNVFYEKSTRVGGPPVKLSEIKKIPIAAGSEKFEEMYKTGFYEFANGIRWTSGHASIEFQPGVELKDSLVLKLDTYMPDYCKDVHPKLSFTDTKNKEYLPVSSERKGDSFYFYFIPENGAILNKINIKSETIKVVAPETRELSFPFIGLEIKGGSAY
ncbi:MAG TPA: hypothetical protein VL832_16510 [Puia sp.]|nr:hypothetical protein [Puia sp.]